MKRRFFGFHSRDKSFDAVQCLLIGDPGGQQPVMIDANVQSDTLFTHELTAVMAGALSSQSAGFTEGWDRQCAIVHDKSGSRH